MKGECIKVKNIEKLQEILKREKNIVIKVIFLNLIVEGIGFEEACRFCETDHQLCFVHLERNIRRNMSKSDAKLFIQGSGENQCQL